MNRLLLTAAVLLLPWLAHGQFLIDPYRFAVSCPVPVYLSNFDGSNDYLSRGSALAGLADAKTFTCSFWIDLNGADGATQNIQKHGAASAGFQISRNTSNQLVLAGYNAAAVQILSATSSTTMLAASGWIHVYIAIDMANSANRHIYFNGTEDAGVTWTTYTDDTIDLNTAASFCFLGSADGATPFLNACVTEYWFDDTYFNDVTKFRDPATGRPVSLGSTGATPTGTSPVFYLSIVGSGTSWAVDSSTNANNFTANGSPNAGSCEPPYQCCTDQIAANTCVFNDATDGLAGIGLNAVVDGKAFTLSTWVRFDGSDGVQVQIFGIGSDVEANDGLLIKKNASNQITILGSSATPATILDATSSQTFTTASGWVHIYIAINLANSSQRHIYFNGTEDSSVTWTTYTDANLDLIASAGDTTEIAMTRSNTEHLVGALAEFWFNDAYLDAPNSFRCSPSNHPITLGSNGSLPLGSAPAVYLSLRGAAASWAVDSSGNANTFTVVGTVSSTTSP